MSVYLNKEQSEVWEKRMTILFWIVVGCIMFTAVLLFLDRVLGEYVFLMLFGGCLGVGLYVIITPEIHMHVVLKDRIEKQRKEDLQRDKK
jgi:hypothetical protein